MFYPFRKVQENYSLFDGILHLPPGGKGNSEPAATE